MRNELITPTELRKIMKLSLTISVDLGFYVSSYGYIDIDQCKNFNPEKVKRYKFKHEYYTEIVTLVNAYARLKQRFIRLCNGAIC